MKIKLLQNTISQGRSVLLQYAYRTQLQVVKFRHRYYLLAITAVLLLLICLSFYLSDCLQNALDNYYKTDQSIDGLRALILNIGSALIGAAAIVTSLVMFAIQVNIERMPHGLFRQLSADKNLIGAFALAFLLAIAIATSSTFTTSTNLSIVVLVTFWLILAILLLFFYAYRRALNLVNPLKQLGFLSTAAQKEIKIWGRRAEHAKSIPQQEKTEETPPPPLNSTHDVTRAAYFLLNSHWTDGAKLSIRHAMSFAQRYAKQGDHEVSGVALKAIVEINAAYVKTKGKTFYATHPFIDNPYSSDGFINDTLETLRQSAQAAIARRDEQQIEQTFQTMTALIQVYLGIDYSSPGATKSHAHLAAGYLSNAVQAVIPHNMADVLMEGLRLMGGAARMILSQDTPNEVSTLSKKIAEIAFTGAIKEDYRPVTLEGMTQLANLTYNLLITKNHDIHYAAEEIRKDVSLVVRHFLNVADTPLSNIHSTYLGPYYSLSSTQSLRKRLNNLVNALSKLEPDNADAKSVITNIERWADGLYRTEKEILLATIKAKSNLTYGIIHWITDVTEILCAVSNSPACETYYKKKLRNHALWLIATLTWIHDDEETITFTENYQLTETLFEVAMRAHNNDCEEVAKETKKILLSWTFKGGGYETGWGILTKGIYGLSVLALLEGDGQVSELKSAISAHLSKESAPTDQIRERTAGNISKRANTLYQRGHWSSSIERSIDQVDHENLQHLLKEIAALLSPDASQDG